MKIERSKDELKREYLKEIEKWEVESKGVV